MKANVKAELERIAVEMTPQRARELGWNANREVLTAEHYGEGDKALRLYEGFIGGLRHLRRLNRPAAIALFNGFYDHEICHIANVVEMNLDCSHNTNV